ncbi:MAG: hypothetical protein IJJ40_00350 [Clostridia bacterium]|nr:hypothetical protein [Clostridia bacterium]
MRQDICTIPVSEVFEVKDGCPLCRMHKTVEEHIITYIMGDAMMESDVRIETNKIGFCPDHYEKMLGHNGRLQLSLMLGTHIDEIVNNLLKEGLSPQKLSQKCEEVKNRCFICEKINWGEERMINTILRLYENEEDFRNLFNSQPHFCFDHFTALVGKINKKTLKHHGEEMKKKLIAATKEYAATLSGKLNRYSYMYDYRKAGSKDFGDSRYSVEESISFLTAGEKGKTE